MFNELREKIKDKKLILIGETHGTKEIPELLNEFFLEIAKEEEFNVCFEISEEFKSKPEEYFKESEFSDGKNSKENFELIHKLECMNIKIVFVAPSEIKNQEELERGIAENVKKVLDDKKTFLILGDIHASKNYLNFGERRMETAGSILFKELNEDLFSVRIMPKSGEFFNFGIKNVDEDLMDEEFNQNFDYIYEVDKVTPCSFLKQ